MVDKRVSDLLLEDMRGTAGFKLLMEELRVEYIRQVRRIVTNGKSLEDLVRMQAIRDTYQNVLLEAGMSKEDVNRWMEIR